MSQPSDSARIVEVSSFARGKTSTSDVIWLALLAVICSGVWIWVHAMWSAEAWRIPPGYDGDGLALLAKIRAFQLGEIHPVAQKEVQSLNAPFAANWNDFPATNELSVWILGLLARAIGMFPAANAAGLIVHLLAAWAFFFSCRLLRYDPALSAIGAIAFAFSSFIANRSFAHMTLAWCWHLPLCLLVSWWAASRSKIEVGRRRYWLSLAIAAVTGSQNPYYLNIFLQFLALSGLSQIARRRWRNTIPVVHIGLTSIGAFLLWNFDTLSYRWQHGENEHAVVRGLESYARFSMVPVRMALPGRHRWEAWEDYGQQRYFSKLAPTPETGEYIGFLGIGGFLWLSATGLWRILRGEAQRNSIHFWQALWTILYSVKGGGNWILGIFFGIYLFRATGRFAIIIQVLVLLFLVREISSRIRWRWPSAVLAVVIAAAVVWDQVPPARHVQRTASPMAGRIASDAEFMRQVELVLPPEAKIFQLPTCDFPEARLKLPKPGEGRPAQRTSARRDCYNLLRPFLYSHALHFSFGAHKGRPRERWQQQLELEPVNKFVTALERLGFSAILIHTDMYPDRGMRLLTELKGAGRTEILQSERGDLVLVGLEPVEAPSLVVWSFGEGWLPQRRYRMGMEERKPPRVRWSSGDSEVLLFNAGSDPETRSLKFRLMPTKRPGKVTVYRGQNPVFEAEVAPRKMTRPPPKTLVIQPGETRIRFVFGDALGVSPDTSRKAAFGVVGIEFGLEDTGH